MKEVEMLQDELVLDLVRRALHEDMGPGDATTKSMVAPEATAQAFIVSRGDYTLSGGAVAAITFHTLDPHMTVKLLVSDGERVSKGTPIMMIKGKAHAILSGERTALNFMQRMSGIATLTAAYVERVQPHPIQILDTRKTTPLLRSLEKYAVSCGGGANHRMGLYDRVMIKDNHLAYWNHSTGKSITDAVRLARQRYPHLKVQVEIDTPEQLDQVLPAQPDWILLDNMTPEQVRTCVTRCGGKAKVEISGGITLETVGDYADTGADAISIGALTHSVTAADLSLEMH